MSPKWKRPPRKDAPALVEWECGCTALALKWEDDEGREWGVVLETCDGYSGDGADWRWNKYGTKRALSDEESQEEWARIRERSAAVARKARRYEELAEQMVMLSKGETT